MLSLLFNTFVTKKENFYKYGMANTHIVKTTW